jgi:hypothetical protein
MRTQAGSAPESRGDLGILDGHVRFGHRPHALEFIPEPAVLLGFVDATPQPPLAAHAGQLLGIVCEPMVLLARD